MLALHGQSYTSQRGLSIRKDSNSYVSWAETQKTRTDTALKWWWTWVRNQRQMAATHTLLLGINMPGQHKGRITTCNGQGWWLMPVIPGLCRLRKPFKFKVSLGYRVNSCLSFKRKKVTSLIHKHIGKYTPGSCSSGKNRHTSNFICRTFTYFTDTKY